MREFYSIKIRPKTFDRLLPARLPISMNSPMHEGEVFKAICKWISHQFNDVTVIIADTLQAYNVRGDKQVALAMGTEWLSRNRDSLSMIQGVKITRWDDWLQHADFSINLSRVNSLYNTDDFFRSTIDLGVSRYLGGFASGPMKEKLEQASRSLLLEESAVIMCDQRHVLEFYPGTVPALKAIKDYTHIKLIRMDVVKENKTDIYIPETLSLDETKELRQKPTA